MTTAITKIQAIFLPLLLILCIGCGAEQGQGAANGEDSTKVAESPDVPSTFDQISGTWELRAKALPDLGEIPLGGDFYTFDSEGQLTIAHPNDPDLLTEQIAYSLEDLKITFNNITYSIHTLGPDSMVLVTETDGIKEESIFLREVTP